MNKAIGTFAIIIFVAVSVGNGDINIGGLARSLLRGAAGFMNGISGETAQPINVNVNVPESPDRPASRGYEQK